MQERKNSLFLVNKSISSNLAKVEFLAMKECHGADMMQLLTESRATTLKRKAGA